MEGSAKLPAVSKYLTTWDMHLIMHKILDISNCSSLCENLFSFFLRSLRSQMQKQQI